MNFLILLIILVITYKFFGIKISIIIGILGLFITQTLKYQNSSSINPNESKNFRNSKYSEKSTEKLYDQLKIVNRNERKIILKELSKRLKTSFEETLDKVDSD